ncbi:MAG: DUF2499 domain-containing protein [Chromatiales bacterium]|nr:DUF2499 domain-containing protein [Chromatiales bacterium]
MGLLWRYGRLIRRPELQVFAVCMGPHLISGLLILGFHLSGDTARGLLEVSRLTNFGGSLAVAGGEPWRWCRRLDVGGGGCGRSCRWGWSGSRRRTGRCSASTAWRCYARPMSPIWRSCWG